jgi:hypothetical protein
MTTSWKKKEEFSIFGNENYSKCSAGNSNGSTANNPFTNFMRYVKMGVNGLIFSVEVPFIYTDRAITLALLNLFFSNTDCIKITDINLLAHTQNNPNALAGNTTEVELLIQKTISDISANLIYINQENANIKNYEKTKFSLIKEKNNYSQNEKVVSSSGGSSFKQDTKENEYDKQIQRQDDLIYESNKKIDDSNSRINKFKSSLSDYKTRLKAMNLMKEELKEPPNCKKLRQEVLDTTISIKKQVYNILGIPLVLFIVYNMYYILCCKAPYGKGSEPIILDIEKTITGKQNIIEDWFFGSYYLIEIIFNAVLYPFTLLYDCLKYLRGCFVNDGGTILGTSNPIKSRLIDTNETYPLIIFLVFCYFIFSFYSSGLYSQLWNMTIYGTPTKNPVTNSDGSVNINESQTASGITDDNYNYAMTISSFVIVFVWLGFVFRFPGIIIKTYLNTNYSLILAIVAFVAFLLFTLALSKKTPLFVMIYLLVISCLSFLFQTTETNYHFFEWYFYDFIAHIQDIFYILFDSKYMEKTEGKFINPALNERTINSSGMFGIVNEVIYKSIYKAASVSDKNCDHMSFFQKIYNAIQKGIFSNIFEILFILILLYGVFDYSKNYAYSSEIPMVLLVLILLNIFFIAGSVVSMYVKYYVREPYMDAIYKDILEKSNPLQEMVGMQDMQSQPSDTAPSTDTSIEPGSIGDQLNNLAPPPQSKL